MIKVESQWLCFISVLFSLALMGICCKNSSWCNGTAYAKISHKPLQLLSEVFHLVWGMFEAFLLTFIHSLCFTHDNSESVTHSVLSPSSPSFSSLNIPRSLFLDRFQLKIKIVFQVELKLYSYFLAWKWQSVLRVSPPSPSIGQDHTQTLAYSS